MERETKKCPYCGEEILAVAKKCRYCGEWLSPKKEQVQESASSETSQSESKNLEASTIRTSEESSCCETPETPKTSCESHEPVIEKEGKKEIQNVLENGEQEREDTSRSSNGIRDKSLWRFIIMICSIVVMIAILYAYARCVGGESSSYSEDDIDTIATDSVEEYELYYDEKIDDDEGMYSDDIEEESSDETQLDYAIEKVNKLNPMQAAPGMTCINLKKNANNVEYTYIVDENILSIEQVEQNCASNREVFASTLMSDGNAVQFFNLVAATHRGVKYTYVGSESGESCTMYFSNQELSDILDGF